MLNKHFDTNGIDILEVRAGRQWEHIDVYVEVNTNQGNYLIVIEDKTFTRNSVGQLERYLVCGENWCRQYNAQLCCVYVKTGSESQKKLTAIRKKGFEPFTRGEFIEILDHFPENNSDILTDFRSRLHQLQRAHDAFLTKPIGKWNNECWIGFYQFLEREMGIVDWDLVNPPGGGQFWNAVLNWEYWHGFPVYLQIEQGKLCFKISHVDSEIEDYGRSEIRNKWHRVILSAATDQQIKAIRKPDRFGTGDYMTCAMVDRHNWLGKTDEFFDAAVVVERLRHYKFFLKSLLTVSR